MSHAPVQTHTISEATALLGVKATTLYAYVSRGRIHSQAGPPGTRERRYHAGDVQALVRRQGVRRDLGAAAREAAQWALTWGMPVLDSALARIADGTLSCRGRTRCGWPNVRQ